ncbi:MAG: hypothetical protein HYX52_02730 [Chloroflexi bacterium]|nr:hypothetical protein [Chloroflexota bacterium]
MVEAHALLANAMRLYFGLVGVWGVVLGLMKRPVDSSYRGALYIAFGLAVVQAAVGVFLVLFGPRRPEDIHYLYGASVIITLPLVRQYLAGRWDRAALAYGLGCLFMFGLTLRAISTSVAVAG